MCQFIIKEFGASKGTSFEDTPVLFCQYTEAHRYNIDCPATYCSLCNLYFCRECNARPDKDMLNLIKLIQPLCQDDWCDECYDRVGDET